MDILKKEYGGVVKMGKLEDIILAQRRTHIGDDFCVGWNKAIDTVLTAIKFGELDQGTPTDPDKLFSIQDVEKAFDAWARASKVPEDMLADVWRAFAVRLIPLGAAKALGLAHGGIVASCPHCHAMNEQGTKECWACNNTLERTQQGDGI